MKSNSYTQAGVDVKKAEDALFAAGKLIQSTYNKAVISPENGFASLYQINKNQVLAAATDGVGTKLDIAIETKIHDTIGIDLVAMCVNDLAVYGIRPLFFLDYLATSKLEPEIFGEVIKGIAEGCKQAGCALIGGETAEMPGFYPGGKYDLAGFAVGLADKADLITGEAIKAGDVIIGLASSGLHSNGFSLVRKILQDNNLSLDMDIDSQKLGQALLKPTVIYTELVQNLKKAAQIKGLAHITGGGFANISRTLPSGAKAVISKNSWDLPAIFSFIQSQGNVGEEEMFDIFNMGIGMAVIANESEAQKVLATCKNADTAAFEIGWIEKGNNEVVIR